MPVGAMDRCRSDPRSREVGSLDRLAVIVLGEAKSGKSTTWNQLFGQSVKTGSKPRMLQVTDHKEVEVFLVSGSPQERKKALEDIIGGHQPTIILCSIQYAGGMDGAEATLDYLSSHGYSLYVQWLNPGYKQNEYPDSLGLTNRILHAEGKTWLSVRDGNEASKRVEEIRQFIHGWAAAQALLVEMALAG